MQAITITASMNQPPHPQFGNRIRALHRRHARGPLLGSENVHQVDCMLFGTESLLSSSVGLHDTDC
jgi:hypothetical protein